MAPPPKYPQDQRDAIASAVLDKGLSVPAALRAAAAGELELPAFQMSTESGYRAVKRERERRTQEQAENQPLDALPALARKLLAATVREGERLERAARYGEYDAESIRCVTRNAQELHKLIRYTDPTSPEQAGKGKAPIRQGTEARADLLSTFQPGATPHAHKAATGMGQLTGQLPGSLERAGAVTATAGD